VKIGYKQGTSPMTRRSSPYCLITFVVLGFMNTILLYLLELGIALKFQLI